VKKFKTFLKEGNKLEKAIIISSLPRFVLGRLLLIYVVRQGG
jgi:hypothetical protein